MPRGHRWECRVCGTSYTPLFKGPTAHRPACSARASRNSTGIVKESRKGLRSVRHGSATLFFHDAAVAQLAEQLFCKQQVTGSIPVGGSNEGRHVMERQERAQLITRSEEHTSELQSQSNLVCRLLLEKKKNI